jgi:DNA-binding NarL/FixJ family response regulator
MSDKIEKVSRYIMVCGTYSVRSIEDNARRVLLSLPRVRFLERDPDYVCPPKIHERILKGETQALRPITNREMIALELRTQKFSYEEIGKKLGVSNNAVRSYVSTARKKIYFQKMNDGDK